MPQHLRRTAALHTLVLAVALAAAGPPARAAAPQPGPPLAIQRCAGAIAIDGDLSDPGWQGVPGITTWYETRVADNGDPQVGNTGYLAYDDRYLYAGFRFEDPDPKRIRAPIADHDQLSGYTDYGGIIVDSGDTGKTAILFLANPNGLTYDAVTNDASGEDSSPDYYWESAGRITDTGWTLEMRVPFSSLRYSRDASPTWGIMLYRNYPRDRHYQFFTARQPRDVNCFVCNSSKLTGLSDLPQSSHLVVAPYTTAQRVDAPRDGLGSSLADGDVESDFGGDVKWSPLANVAFDATYNPDFSQVESDVAQIGVNERFALFYPEKRSFFLEGKDLFTTQLNAVHTRSITAPQYGGRVTGRLGSTSFTALGAHDEGGGLVILPGPEGSGFAEQDFHSDVGVLRLRHDLGPSFLGLLATGRTIDGGGHNAVFGPDLEWRPRPTDTFAAQALWSTSHTPDRPGLAAEWDGRRLEDHALFGSYNHGTRSTDFYLQGLDIGPDFRADQGFMPQVGYRDAYLQAGWTVRPREAFLSRLRSFVITRYSEDDAGRPLRRLATLGAGMDGRWNSFVRVELNREQLKVGPTMLTRFRPYLILQSSPGRVVNAISLEAYVGEEIDFANAREGTGATLIGGLTVRPGDHLELRGDASTRWLDVDDPTLGSGRLFLAHIERLRASYAFSARSFVRLIGQHVATTREPALYTFAVEEKDADLSLSALVGYKLNWQTVMYAGYGDDRTFATVTDRLEPSGRQWFAKLSYALQR